MHSISNLREKPLPSSAAAARHPHRLIPWLPPAQLRRLAPRPLSQAAALPSLSSTQAALCSSLLKVTLCRAYSSFLAEDSSFFFFPFYFFFLPSKTMPHLQQQRYRVRTCPQKHCVCTPMGAEHFLGHATTPQYPLGIQRCHKDIAVFVPWRAAHLLVLTAKGTGAYTITYHI